MQVWKKVIAEVNGKLSEMTTLFDPGSSFTIMGYGVLDELFGEVRVKRLAKAREVLLATDKGWLSMAT